MSQGLTPPAGRYGPQRTGLSRRAAVTATGLALAAAIGVAAWAAFGGSAEVAWRDLGYKVTSDVLTEVTFEVTMDPGTEAVCTVRALNVSFAEVGLVDVGVGPSPARTTRVRAKVPTSEEAVTGLVKGCAVRAG